MGHDVPLIADYPTIKMAHVFLVLVSGALFVIRGTAVLTHQAWPMRKEWRLTSYLIDTGLLGAGLTLWFLLQLNPLANPWLGTKLILLVVYITLGSIAIKRGQTQQVRVASFIAAIAVYLSMGCIAMAHHPLGFISRYQT